MPKVSDLASVLSQKPIVLIVGDRITKEYLYAAWGPDQQYFNILTSGGHQVVKGAVEDLRKHGNTTAFGLIDRDFGKDNVARWSASDSPPYMFRPTHHELENFLLDWPALAGCDLNQRRNNPRTADEIRVWAEIEAAKQPWWLACRSCLAELQRLHGAGFPAAPKIPVITDFQNALDHIINSNWFSGLQAQTGKILDTSQLEARIRAAESQYRAEITSGDWMRTFSGKEIFNHLLSRIHAVPNSPSAEPDVDLAKSVGAWQCANSAIPREIDILRLVLKTRVGIP